MLSTITKYFFILICSCFFASNIFDIKVIKKQRVAMLTINALVSAFVYFIRQYSSNLSILFIAIALVSLIYFVFKKPLNITFIISIVSLGASYVLHSIAVLLLSPIIYIGSNIIRTQSQYDIFEPVLFLTTGIVQLVILYLFFKIKRFKLGISFLIKSGGTDIGVFLSISILLAVSFFNVKDEAEKIYIIPMFFILLCGVILFFMWHNRITHLYIEKQKINEIEILQKELDEKNRYAKQLESDNNSLAKIIHRDNKIIPVMQVAISEIISSYDDSKIANQKIISLSNQISEMASERYGVIQKYETQNKKLPICGIASLNALFKYMENKATINDIAFDVSLLADINNIVNILIMEKDLNILLADICENAIIATKGVQNRRILLSINTKNEYYSIDVFDSGVFFAEDTILKLGKERVTTHLNSGGSGIGLMTVMEILKRYNASFIIEEFTDNMEFTKKLSIYFDGANEYRIKSARQEIIACCSNRNDIVLL